MLERLDMSKHERDKLYAIRSVLGGGITQAEAAQMIGCTDRQVRRLCTRVELDGDRALVHGLRGQPSNNRHDEELLGKALSGLHDPLWHGFGPSFAQEQLDELCRIELGVTTIRRLMLLTDLWEAGRHGARHRACLAAPPRFMRASAGSCVQAIGTALHPPQAEATSGDVLAEVALRVDQRRPSESLRGIGSYAPIPRAGVYRIEQTEFLMTIVGRPRIWRRHHRPHCNTTKSMIAECAPPTTAEQLVHDPLGQPSEL